jgi:hypothetical protein
MKKDKKNLTEKIEKALSDVVSDFVNCARLQQGSGEQLELAHKWNEKVNKFFEKYPKLSVADIAMGLKQLGILYEIVMKDVTIMRS